MIEASGFPRQSRCDPESVRSCQCLTDIDCRASFGEDRAMARRGTYTESDALHVSIVALPDAVLSTLAGIYDVMNGASLMGLIGPGAEPPFRIDIVGEITGPMPLASGLPIDVQRAIDSIDASDIVIVPSVLLQSAHWEMGRYPLLVEWLQRMHRGGAVLCSACSGIFLLAETGLWDGRDATVHFDYAAAFGALMAWLVREPRRAASTR